jgi:hypothetical protein
MRLIAAETAVHTSGRAILIVVVLAIGVRGIPPVVDLSTAARFIAEFARF